VGGRVGQNVGGLGHEVNAAEDDPAAVAIVGGHAAELEAVAGEVGELVNLVLLIMMAEDQELVAQSRFDGADPTFEVLIGTGPVRSEFQSARIGRCLE
jgi:hypothetical protein